MIFTLYGFMIVSPCGLDNKIHTIQWANQWCGHGQIQHPAKSSISNKSQRETSNDSLKVWKSMSMRCPNYGNRKDWQLWFHPFGLIALPKRLMLQIWAYWWSIHPCGMSQVFRLEFFPWLQCCPMSSLSVITSTTSTLLWSTAPAKNPKTCPFTSR